MLNKRYKIESEKEVSHFIRGNEIEKSGIYNLFVDIKKGDT